MNSEWEKNEAGGSVPSGKQAWEEPRIVTEHSLVAKAQDPFLQPIDPTNPDPFLGAFGVPSGPLW